jgi:hypothetical protein
MKRRTLLRYLAAGAAAGAAHELLALPALAQWEKRSAFYPLPGKYTFALRRNFPTVYRYLNVIDIGHAELAETLHLNRGREDRAIHLLEHGAFEQVKEMFLDPRKAPRLAVHEETVAPESAKLAPRLNRAFEWAHILHRQVYDILATDFSMDEKKKFIRESYNWYARERDRVFPAALKTHDLMEHQWFSQYWRQRYPRFNGAIWAYHWYQLRLNEVMLAPDAAQRSAGVDEATSEFRAMFENEALLPRHMPMAHTIAPAFLAGYPEISNVFDNLHAFHDIYNDILAHPKITDKRGEVYKQLDIFLDPQQMLESAPREPLPAGLSRDVHRRLNQLEHLEHMAMMVMPAAEQLAFINKSAEERGAIVQKLMPEMARHWPNLEKKHAEMGHTAPHKH